MPKNDLGDLRRSAAASGFGPGAIVDFRAGNAPISALAAGLEEWDRNFPPAGILHPQTVREERLQKKLGVKGFRLPPVRDPQKDTDADRALVGVRFPHWLQCPQCDLIGDEGQWSDEPGHPARWCADCSRHAPGRTKVAVVPVRFVMACEAGHLDEFPWHAWVGHGETCRNRRGFLKLVSEEAGLAGALPMFGCIALIIGITLFRGMRRSRMTHVLFALVAADLVFLIHGFTDFALQTPSMAMMWSYLLGLQFALSQGSRR